MRHGFTLIELAIVIAIISLLAAIALPSLLRSRLETNEAAAIENLRTITTAEISFASDKSRFGDFTALTEETAPGGNAFLLQTWNDGVVKAGYAFTIDSADVTQFLCYADPVRPGLTGNRYFRVDASGIIRYNQAGRPGPADPVIASN